MGKAEAYTYLIYLRSASMDFFSGAATLEKANLLSEGWVDRACRPNCIFYLTESRSEWRRSSWSWNSSDSIVWTDSAWAFIRALSFNPKLNHISQWIWDTFPLTVLHVCYHCFWYFLCLYCGTGCAHWVTGCMVIIGWYQLKERCFHSNFWSFL